MLKKIDPTGPLAALRGSGAVVSLLRAIRDRQALLERILPLLPVDLRDHCRAASIDGQRLRLIADSPVWASKLRLICPELVQALAREHLKLKGCTVRVSPPLVLGDPRSSAGPPTADPQTPRQARRYLSAAAADHLEQAARSMDDPRLAACLRRIAALGR